jgi:hypothetical protein
MHRRGTHCGRSDRKTQINRAQFRWYNGTADDKASALSEEETIPGAGAGKVHAITLARTAVKSIAALPTAGVAGSGGAVGDDSVTQQQEFLATQQGQAGSGAGAESVWAAAITCSQIIVRLRRKAVTRFMVLIYCTYRLTSQSDSCDSCVTFCQACPRYQVS